MNKILLTGLSSFLLLLIFSSGIATSCIATGCNTTEPPPPKNNGTLTLCLTETSCTEAWVNLKTQNISFPAQINFTLDSKSLKNISLTSGDTTIYIDSLLPNKTYTLQASGIGNQVSGIQSNKLSIATLDTTSNNFTWQTFTFGEPGAGSSHLSDVAIINENNIWAVGEIYMNDSTGKPDPLPYNAVHWYEGKWTVMRITVDFRGNQITPPLEGVFAFSSTDIWLVGSLPIHGDGQNWVMYDLRSTVDPNLSLSKAWGANANDMYFVGRSGSIAHYLNGQWQKIESGTNLNIYDIWGDYNINKSEYEIYASASNKGKNFDKRLLKISSSSSDSVTSRGIPASIVGIWFKAGIQYYTAGDGGIYKKRDIENSEFWQKISSGTPPYYIEATRGNGINDIFMCGDFGELLHFNGSMGQAGVPI